VSDTARDFPHVVIRASAGTGKTFQLSNRFIGLVGAGAAPESILATTFARKASAEILDRVLLRVADAIESDKPLRELQQTVPIAGLDRNTCGQLLDRLLKQLHRLRIGTLDSFFIQLAGSFGFELGLPTGWRIVEELYDEHLRSEAIREVLETESTGEVVTLMRLLSKGDVTRSVSEQIRGVVRTLHGLYAETDEAAWHVLNRRSHLDDDELAACIEAFHALREFDDKRWNKAHATSIELLKAGDWVNFAKKGLPPKLISGEQAFYNKPVEADVLDVYEPVVDHAQAVLVNRIVDRTDAQFRLLEKFDVAYRRLQRRERALRFGDVTNLLSDGLAAKRIHNPDFRLDAAVAHLVLDEFQDTSLAQWNVLRSLAERIVTAGDDRSFFCVGDVKQAIYGWRGGVSELFDELDSQLPGLTPDWLDKSFRSSPVIIEAVNEVFDNLATNPILEKNPTVVAAWTERFKSHETERIEYPGYAQLLAADMAGEKEKQGDVTLDFAADEIARLVKSHPGCSVGVLVRRNKSVARLIYRLRNAHDIFASEEGGNPLTDSVAVQLILSLLKLADHPGDTAARFHVAHSPLGPLLGLNDSTDDDAARHLSLSIREQLADEGYGRTLYVWVCALAESCDSRELGRLKQLVEAAYGYDASATVRPRDFVRHVEATRVESPTSAPVRVMTVHQAKGLQFDLVVLPELDVRLKGQPPEVIIGRSAPTEPINIVCAYVSQSMQPMLPKRIQQAFADHDGRTINELLCVLYVAVTRAVHAVHLIVAPSKIPKKNEKTGKPSIAATLAGLLHHALVGPKALAPGETAWELGAPDWFASSSETANPVGAANTTREHAPQPLTIRLRKSAERQRSLPHRSPSSLEARGCVDLAWRLNRDRATVLSRGSLFHAWFENVSWLESGEPNDETLRALAVRFPGAVPDVDAAIARFREMLQNPVTKQTLSRIDYEEFGADCELELFRERPFAIQRDGGLLEGIIDRLVVIRREGQPVAADIIDFKSDRLSDDATLSRAVETYRPQLEAYREAVGKLVGVSAACIAARLLFVDLDVVSVIEPA
jgi:ATP-dependent helicase/nuclease subunit A